MKNETKSIYLTVNGKELTRQSVKLLKLNDIIEYKPLKIVGKATQLGSNDRWYIKDKDRFIKLDNIFLSLELMQERINN